MNAILTILTGIVSGACFFAIYEYGRQNGIKEQSEKQSQDALKITDKNKKAIKDVIDFINYKG